MASGETKKLRPLVKRWAPLAVIVLLMARSFGLGTSGVDLLRSEAGPKVLEVNSSPGFEGIENATGKDIVGLVYDMVEARVRPQAVRRRK